MDFANFPQTVKLLTVMEIPRKKGNGFTSGRDFHALSFRVKGDAVFTTKNKITTAKNESIALVPEGVSYGIETEEELLYVVHFTTDIPLEADNIFTFTPNVPAFYENQFKKIYDLWKNKNTGYYFAALSVFYTILENIHSNFTDPALSVPILAEKFGTSETYFRKVFKLIYGKSPLKYINNLRIERAFELLRSGYFSVAQVSENSGFADVKYFSRIIKSKTGISPSKLNK